MVLMLVSRPLHSTHSMHRAANASGFSARWVSGLCLASFFLGVVFVHRLWAIPEVDTEKHATSVGQYATRNAYPSVNCEKKLDVSENGDFLSQVSKPYDIIIALDKTISSLEMQLAAARAAKAESEKEPTDTKIGDESSNNCRRVFFVMGIITAFSSRKRRDSIREAWMPQGNELKKLEKEKGIVIRFVIGHSATPGGVLDRAIDAEEAQHKDFLRLNHVEGYHELSSKTQIYFSTATAKWDADFYIKVDDDVHVNLGEQSIMNLNIGNLARRETSILGMQLDKFMQYQRIWLCIFLLTGAYSIGMQMKMFLLGLGSLVLMLIMLMIEACVVGHTLIVSGRHRLEPLVQRRLIGVAVGYASQLIEWMRFISVVVREMEQFGTPVIEYEPPTHSKQPWALGILVM